MLAQIRMLQDYANGYLGREVAREEGQTMAEYSMILGLISIAIVAAFMVGPTITDAIAALVARIGADITP